MSQGNAADFGDSTANRGGSGASNDTTGLYAGGVQFSDRCDQFHHATTGRFVDFGNLANAAAGKLGFGSPIRGFFCAGDAGSPNDRTNSIEHFTFDSAGNGTDFADLSVAMRQGGAANNDTRAIVAHANAPATTALCDVFNFVTGGNASSFGDLTEAREAGINCGSNPTKIVFAGGWTGSANSNVIDSFQFATLGNAVDFGDLTVARHQGAQGQSVSNGHGGLSGGTFQRPSVTYMPGSGRALFNGGQTAPADALVSTVEMFHIPTAGNAVDFGELNTVVSNGPGNGASNTRSIIYTGYSPASPYYDNTIQATTFASFGNYFDFGDPTQQRYANSYGNIGSPTRAIFMGGYAPGSPYYVNIIDYVTIATVGNGTDFGDLAAATNNVAGCGSSTRGIGMGGYTGSQDDTIQYVTIASTGNATDFGNLTTAKSGGAGVSSSTRGVLGGGNTGSVTNVIEYVTIASTGNGTDFGDLTQARKSLVSASNSDRGLFMGGATPSKVNTVDFITIASTGDATDFGDLTVATRESGGTSDSHGGLQA